MVKAFCLWLKKILSGPFLYRQLVNRDPRQIKRVDTTQGGSSVRVGGCCKTGAANCTALNISKLPLWLVLNFALRKKMSAVRQSITSESFSTAVGQSRD